MSDIEDLADMTGVDIPWDHGDTAPKRIAAGKRFHKLHVERRVHTVQTYARIVPSRNVTLPKLKFLENGSDE